MNAQEELRGTKRNSHDFYFYFFSSPSHGAEEEFRTERSMLSGMQVGKADVSCAQKEHSAYLLCWGGALQGRGHQWVKGTTGKAGEALAGRANACGPGGGRAAAGKGERLRRERGPGEKDVTTPMGNYGKGGC